MRKHLLLFLLAVFSFALSANAETATYTCTALGSATINDITSTTVSVGDAATLSFSKSSGQTAPAYNKAGDIRLYAKNTLTITGKTGITITNISFSLDNTQEGPVTASTGTVSQTKQGTTATWTGSATSIILTVGDKADFGSDTNKAGQFRIKSLTITYTKAGGSTDPDPTKTPATISFDNDKGPYTADLADGANWSEAPIASVEPNEASKYLTYSSSKPEVATVNPSTGLVTLIGKGETTITAYLSDDNTEYTADPVTYDLTVIDSNSRDPEEFFNVTLTNENEYNNFDVNNVNLGTLGYVWQYDKSYGAKASAYVSSKNNPSESWLITPIIALRGYTNVTFNFDHATNYFNSTANAQKYTSIKVSVDGSDEWKDVTNLVTYPTTQGWTFINSGNINISEFDGKKIRIAFVYTSDNNVAGTWEIKSLSVSGVKDPNVPELKTPELKWMSGDKAVTEFTYDLFAKATLPSLSAPEGVTVAYTSSNTAVATVEGGVITPVAVGETTITAVSAENDVYADGKAELKLTVINTDVNEFTDVIDITKLDGTVGNSYKNGTYTPEHGLVSYSWCVMGTNNMQINPSNQNKPGIVVSDNKRGYIVESVTINWNDGTTVATNPPRNITVYGLEGTVYESYTDLSSSEKRGDAFANTVFDKQNLNWETTTEFAPEHVTAIGFLPNATSILNSISIKWVKPYAKEYTALNAYGSENPLEIEVEKAGKALTLGHCHPESLALSGEGLEISEDFVVTATKAGLLTAKATWNSHGNRWTEGNTDVYVKVKGKEFKPALSDGYTLVSGDTEMKIESDIIDFTSALKGEGKPTVTLTIEDGEDLVEIDGYTISAKNDVEGLAMVTVAWEGDVWEPGSTDILINVVRNHVYSFEATRVTDPAEIVNNNLYIMLGYNNDNPEDFYMGMTAYDNSKKAYVSEQAKFEEQNLSASEITAKHHPLASNAIAIVKFEKDEDGEGFHMNVNGLDGEAKYIKTNFGYSATTGKTVNNIELVDKPSDDTYVVVSKYDDKTDRFMLKFSKNFVTKPDNAKDEEEGDEVEEPAQPLAVAAVAEGEQVNPAFQYNATSKKFSAYSSETKTVTGLYLYRLYFRQKEDLVSTDVLLWETTELPEGVAFENLETTIVNNVAIMLNFEKEDAEDFEVEIDGKAYRTDLDGDMTGSVEIVNADLNVMKNVKVRYIKNNIPSIQFPVALTDVENALEGVEISEVTPGSVTFNAYDWNGEVAKVSATVPYTYNHTAVNKAHYVAEYGLNDIEGVIYNQDTHTATIPELLTIELTLDECNDPSAILAKINAAEAKIEGTVKLHFPFVYSTTPIVESATEINAPLATLADAPAYGTAVYTAEAPISHLLTANNDGVTTGVEDITAGDSNATPEYYNLQGVRVANPVSGGVYIVRTGNTTAKVLVR